MMLLEDHSLSYKQTENMKLFDNTATNYGLYNLL